MLTLILNHDVFTRMGEENVEWLRSRFQDHWLDLPLFTLADFKTEAVEEMLGIGKSGELSERD